jgi:hypothetical protein
MSASQAAKRRQPAPVSHLAGEKPGRDQTVIRARITAEIAARAEIADPVLAFPSRCRS